MCGRYTLRTPLTVLAQQFLFDLGDLPQDEWTTSRDNICPTQDVAVVRQPVAGGRRELAMLHWGLIPSWAKDKKMASSMINARSETVAEKPAFRTALARCRCLILADGFYEWKKEGKKRLPFLFQTKDELPFAFAGLWERWRGSGASGKSPDESQPPLESCTIITTEANDLCRPVHERMPVILDPADYDLWLDPAVTDAQRLLPLLTAYPTDQMSMVACTQGVPHRSSPSASLL
jgi:putative SOS response-associated peptidase YedK